MKIAFNKPNALPSDAVREFRGLPKGVALCPAVACNNGHLSKVTTIAAARQSTSVASSADVLHGQWAIGTELEILRGGEFPDGTRVEIVQHQKSSSPAHRGGFAAAVAGSTVQDDSTLLVVQRSYSDMQHSRQQYLQCNLRGIQFESADILAAVKQTQEGIMSVKLSSGKAAHQRLTDRNVLVQGTTSGAHWTFGDEAASLGKNSDTDKKGHTILIPLKPDFVVGTLVLHCHSPAAPARKRTAGFSPGFSGAGLTQPNAAKCAMNVLAGGDPSSLVLVKSFEASTLAGLSRTRTVLENTGGRAHRFIRVELLCGAFDVGAGFALNAIAATACSPRPVISSILPHIKAEGPGFARVAFDKLCEVIRFQPDAALLGPSTPAALLQHIAAMPVDTAETLIELVGEDALCTPGPDGTVFVSVAGRTPPCPWSPSASSPSPSPTAPFDNRRQKMWRKVHFARV